ncbi:hypothetical protein OUZ56_010809 [Daphnia magna]|uniref:Secreted protein n=1 Tax=Daphnia magna TaxID=35525 RepID=A0ABQ9YYK2_9CRUS|nr:hypothetical protein OUZ56_010809 [Daphnia magna]
MQTRRATLTLTTVNVAALSSWSAAHMQASLLFSPVLAANERPSLYLYDAIICIERVDISSLNFEGCTSSKHI